jgi:predicted porin
MRARSAFRQRTSTIRFTAGLVLAMTLAAPQVALGQASNVTLYGRANLDLEFVNGRQPDGSNATVSRVSSNSSRFGLRGTEVIGNDLTVFFQLENSVNWDGNGGTIAGRESYLGMQGNWGDFKIGNFLTPYDDIHTIFGNVPTLATSILSTAAIWAQGPLDKQAGGFDARLGNSIRYDTPTLRGFSGEFQYSTRDDSGTIGPDNGDHPSVLRHANVVGAGAFYTDADIDLGVAYERNTQVRAPGENDTAFTVAGAYDFGVLMDSFDLRIGGVYERLKYGTLSGSLQRDFWGVSATALVGGGVIYAFWGRAGNGTGGAVDGTVIGGLVKGPNSGADQWEVSYSYNLSERTMLYAGYVRLNNQANALYSFNINPYPTAPGGNPGGVVFGIAHFF